jgi:sulfotransferase family protein
MVSLEVMGVGFGRTGTMSLKMALEQLGYSHCYHMIELFEHPEHVERWEAAVRGEPVDWEEVFAGYRATVDWPGVAFYKELVEAHPKAKVLSASGIPKGGMRVPRTPYTRPRIPPPR